MSSSRDRGFTEKHAYQPDFEPERRGTVARKPVRSASLNTAPSIHSYSASYHPSPPSTIHENDEVRPATGSGAPFLQVRRPSIGQHRPSTIQEREEITPLPTPAWNGPTVPFPTPAGGITGHTPFMHYEDFEYFAPMPKDETNVDVRDAEAVSLREDVETKADMRQGTQDMRPPVRRRRCLSRFAWLPEILCCLVSIGCVVALAMVLRKFDGWRLADWPLGISLHTLVAFLASVTQATFVYPVMVGLSQLKWNWFALSSRPLKDFDAFETATTGPFGSVRLVMTTKGRFLGTTAAILLLTTLITSPMTQAIVDYPTRFVSGVGTATVQRSERYSLPENAETLPALQKQALHLGLYQPPNEPLPPLPPSCPNEACTFPTPISTLAICLLAADATDKLTISPFLFDMATFATLNLPYTTPLRLASLPNAASLTGTPDTYTLNISTSPLLPAANAQPGDQTLYFGNRSDGALAAAVADLFVVYITAGGQFRAEEVLLHFCVEEYDVVDNGGGMRRRGPSAVVKDGGSGSGSGNGELVLAGGNGTEYTVEGAAMGVLGDYLATTMRGAYSGTGAMGVGGSAVGDVYGEVVAAAGRGGDVEEMRAVIYNVTQNLAMGLTNSIRSLGTTTSGTTTAAEGYIRVRWEWLACLVIQVSLSTAFLAGVIAQSTYLRVKVVKNSALATLVAVSADDKAYLERENSGCVEDRHVLRHKLGGVRGRFRKLGDRGWALDVRRKGAAVR